MGNQGLRLGVVGAIGFASAKRLNTQRRFALQMKCRGVTISFASQSRPHHRTTAPPHHRTTAPPHHRTTAPPKPKPKPKLKLKLKLRCRHRYRSGGGSVSDDGMTSHGTG